MNKKIKPAIAVIVLIFLVAMIGLLSHVIMKRIPTKEKMDLNEYYGELGMEKRHWFWEQSSWMRRRW